MLCNRCGRRRQASRCRLGNYDLLSGCRLPRRRPLQAGPRRQCCSRLRGAPRLLPGFAGSRLLPGRGLAVMGPRGRAGRQGLPRHLWLLGQHAGLPPLAIWLLALDLRHSHAAQ